MSSYGGQEAAMQFMNAVMGFSFGLVFLLMLVFYVFEAIGLYTISKNRGYQKPWLAFIPVANAWVLGGIADNIGHCFGKSTRWRIYLVAMEAVWSIAYFVYVVLLMAAFPEMLRISMLTGGDYSAVMHSGWMQIVTIAPLISLVSMGRVVLRAIVSYKLYQDYSPKNAVLFLVLSILLGIGPFLLFAVRNRLSATLYWRSQPRPPYPPPPYGAPPAGPGGSPFR